MLQTDVRKNLEKIENQLSAYPSQLLPVSKTFGVERILEAYQEGYRAFGENRVQELVPKFQALPKDIEWHLIGHLQTNKVKYIAPFIGMIQSVDSEKLLAEIDKQAFKVGRKIACLFQVYISNDESKFGWEASELLQFYESDKLKDYANIEIQGLMGMASLTEDEERVRSEFKLLKSLFEQLKAFDHFSNSKMKTLSMGMSGDFLIAAQEGSTLVRMGSAIFGGR
jgi:pyridoxal phosphate enzyme (YggS family)